MFSLVIAEDWVLIASDKECLVRRQIFRIFENNSRYMYVSFRFEEVNMYLEF